MKSAFFNTIALPTLVFAALASAAAQTTLPSPPPSLPDTDPQTVISAAPPLAGFENQTPRPMRWLARNVYIADYALIAHKNGFYSVKPRNQSQNPLPSVTWSDIVRKANRDGELTSKQEKDNYEKYLKLGYDPNAAWFKSLHYPKLKGTVYAFAAAQQGSQKVGEITLNTDLHHVHMFTGNAISTTLQAKKSAETGRKAYAIEELAAWNNTQALVAPLRSNIAGLNKTAQGNRIVLFSNMPDDDPYIALKHDTPANIVSQIKQQISTEKANSNYKTKSCKVDAYALTAQKSRNVYVAQCSFVENNYPGAGIAVFELNAAGNPVVVRFAQHYPAEASPTGKAVTLAVPLSNFMPAPKGVYTTEYQAFHAVLDLNPANKGKPNVVAQMIMSETNHHESPFGSVQYVPSAQAGGVWLRFNVNEVSPYLQ